MNLAAFIFIICAAAGAAVVVGGIWHALEPDKQNFEHINMEDLQ